MALLAQQSYMDILSYPAEEVNGFFIGVDPARRAVSGGLCQG